MNPTALSSRFRVHLNKQLGSTRLILEPGFSFGMQTRWPQWILHVGKTNSLAEAAELLNLPAPIEEGNREIEPSLLR